MSTNLFNREFGRSQSVALRPLEQRQRIIHRTIPYRAVTPLAMAFDMLVIFATSILSNVIYNIESAGVTGDIRQPIGFAAVFAALFVSLAKSQGVYKLSELLNFRSQLRNITVAWLAIFLFLTAIAFVTKLGPNFSRGAVLSFAASGLTALIVVRVGWRLFLADGLAVKRFSNRKVALVVEQSSESAPAVLSSLMRHGFQPTHQFALPEGLYDISQQKAFSAQLISSLRGSDVEEIVVSVNLDRWSEISAILLELRVLPLPINLIPTGQLVELFKLPLHTVGNTVNIEWQRGNRTLFERAAKRSFDIIVASTAIIMLMPLFVTTALAIKIDSPGPIIFRQRRRGFNGRPFQILKFRTMTVLEDGDRVIQARPNDVRVTRIGNWLRRTSIDELPQLINVLQGSMSIVGPRPHAMAHDNAFDKIISNYALRHHVKPGMTGWAQVNGRRGQTPTVTDMEQRTALDLWYINNWSLAVDLKILFLTMSELVFSKNAY